MRIYKFSFTLCLMLLFTTLFGASTALALDVPKHSGSVVDLAGLLSLSQKAKLSLSLNTFQRQKGPQIQLLIVPTLAGDALESYTIKVVDQWKLGDAKRDDGVLLFVAVAERKIRIEVGQGLEGDLPDVIAGRIIKETMQPFFKQGQFSQGLVNGLHAIAQQLGGSLANVAPPKQYRSKKRGGYGQFIFLGMFILFSLLGKGRRGGGSGLLTGLLLGSMMGGGRSSGGFGGGFGGGGGGGFSGGGASGGW